MSSNIVPLCPSVNQRDPKVAEASQQSETIFFFLNLSATFTHVTLSLLKTRVSLVVFFFFIIVERGKCGQAVGLFLFLPAVNHLQFKQGPKCDFPFSSLAAITIMCTFISYFYLRLSFCPPTSLSVCLVLQSAVLSCFVIKLVTPREGEREFC